MSKPKLISRLQAKISVPLVSVVHSFARVATRFNLHMGIVFMKPGTIGPIDVASGGNTLIGDVRLDYATGGCRLGDDRRWRAFRRWRGRLIGSSSPQSQFLDADGQFSFGNMRVGTYSLSIRLDDYVALSFTEVTVNPNVVTTLSDMALAIDPGGIAGRVLMRPATDSKA